MTQHQSTSRNLLGFDDLPWSLEAPMTFAADGGPSLLAWVPDANSETAGAFDYAPAGGAGGVTGVFKRATGDFRVVLQDKYKRVKSLVPTWENSLQLGVASPDVRLAGGRMDGLYPDCTSMYVERLAARGTGAVGTGTESVQPKFVVASAVFISTFVGMTLTDSAGSTFEILGLVPGVTTSLFVSGVATPASGASWSITAPDGTVVVNNTIMDGSVSVVAYVAATWTVSGAGWLVNQWRGHVLEDYTGRTYTIASNTATVITLAPVERETSIIAEGIDGNGSSNVFTVTGGGPSVAADAYIGYFFNDTTNVFYIQDNSTLTATTGTITTLTGTSPAGSVTNGWVSTSPNGPVGGPWVIRQGNTPGRNFPVTGPQITGTANTGTGTANTWTPAATTNWVAGLFAGMWLVDGDGESWRILTNSTTTLTVASNGSDTTPTTGTIWQIYSFAGAASVEFTCGALGSVVGTLTAAAQTFTGTAHVITGSNAASASLSATAAAQTFTGAAGSLAASTPTAGTLEVTQADLQASLTTDTVLPFDADAPVTGSTGPVLISGAPTGTNSTSAVTGTAAAQVFTGENYTPVGTNSTSAVTGTITTSRSLTNPASGERLILTVAVSDGIVMS